jgi:probable rRNA maturation factor
VRRSFDFRVSIAAGSFAVLSRYDAKGFASDEALSQRFQIDRAFLRRLGRFLLDLSCERSATVNIRFCDVDEMRLLNRQFRGKDRPTDVLSFPSSSALDFLPGSVGSGEISMLGELVVCLPVCLWQTRQARHSISREVERMVVHGLSHLFGFDHERSEAAWRLQTSLEKAMAAEVQRNFGRHEWVRVVKSAKKNRAR